jgi:probable HAF family extracellular repeat protein
MKARVHAERKRQRRALRALVASRALPGRRAVGCAAACGVLVGLAAAPASASRKEAPPPPPPPPAATYSITDLGNLGFQNTRAFGIANSGQVTGYSGTPKTVEGSCSLRFRPCPTHVYHAFLWQAGTMADLGTLGGNYSEGLAVNDLGEVVGRSNTKSGERHAFVFRGGRMTDLDAGLTGREISASAINDLGVIAGSESIPGEGHTDAVMWQNGKLTDLGLLPGEGGIYADPAGLNNSDEIAGTGDNRESMMRAWVWRNGTMTDIGTLGGPQAAAYAINNDGQVVGFAQTSTDADHGFIYQSGKMSDIGLNVFPYAINNNGVIAGSGGCGAAIIVSGGACENLQNLIPAGTGYVLEEAKGINDKGQIIAYARLETDPGHPVHAVLLTPN